MALLCAQGLQGQLQPTQAALQRVKEAVASQAQVCLAAQMLQLQLVQAQSTGLAAFWPGHAEAHSPCPMRQPCLVAAATRAGAAQVPDLQQQVASLKLQLAAETDRFTALRANLSILAPAAPAGMCCCESGAGARPRLRAGLLDALQAC